MIDHDCHVGEMLDLLDGNRITEQNTITLAHFDDPAFNRRIEAAQLLSGPSRYSTFGRLDVDIMRKAAPWAPTRLVAASKP